MQCVLIETIGFRWEFAQSWYDEKKEYHVQEYTITKEQYDTNGFDDLAKIFGIPTICTRCNQEYKNEELKFYNSRRNVWNTSDGNNDHPGDMFYAPWMHSVVDGKIKCMYWDNCNDIRGHLLVVLPNGHVFDTDMRASNCNKLEDRMHRCWEKKGEPPLVTIGGPSSDNGVGSIGMAAWHGYLTNGDLHT